MGEDNVGENNPEDMKITIMDPNTRTLIRVKIEDYENDMQIFQILRGGSAGEMAQRRSWLYNFHLEKSMIDT